MNSHCRQLCCLQANNAYLDLSGYPTFVSFLSCIFLIYVYAPNSEVTWVFKQPSLLLLDLVLLHCILFWDKRSEMQHWCIPPTYLVTKRWFPFHIQSLFKYWIGYFCLFLCGFVSLFLACFSIIEIVRVKCFNTFKYLSLLSREEWSREFDTIYFKFEPIKF